jgi:hypothetical protein
MTWRDVLRRLQGMLRPTTAHEPPVERLYLVFGNSKLDNIRVSGPTDPASYGLDIYAIHSVPRDTPVHVHAYTDVSDVVNAMYACGLEPYGSFLKAYRRVGGEWVVDDAEAGRVIDETPW